MQKEHTNSLLSTQLGDSFDEELMHHNQIRDVWSTNFEQELNHIITLYPKYPIISIDTQFPGIYTQCLKWHPSQNEYTDVRSNVEVTKLIQLGLTLSNDRGQYPEPISTWQINFRFDLRNDNTVKSSVQLLSKAGIDFKRMVNDGVEHQIFAQRFINSGLIINKRIKWIAFHGSSDFTYLLRMLRNEATPATIEDYYKSIRIYFPTIIDLKCIISLYDSLKTYSLNKLSQMLQCQRIGPNHQAGSDSQLTSQCYFALAKNIYFNQAILQQYSNIIYGLWKDDKIYKPQYQRKYKPKQ